MGLLSLGTPLHWDDAKRYAEHVRSHGIAQFINAYNALKDRRNDVLLWGDEVEYLVIHYDHENKNAKLSTRVFEMLEKLSEEERNAIDDPSKPIGALWRPEYGRFMLEGTPGTPYGGTLKDLLQVEPSMKLRRRLAKEQMNSNEIPLTLTSFPRLGCEDFVEPYSKPDGGVTRSLFVPDEIINPHARFGTLTANIRRRRGSKVNISIPIFIDQNTPRPFIDPTVTQVAPEANATPADSARGASPSPPFVPPQPDKIYMDAMAFGMGCCCLQITFQACNITEARRLNDQLAVLAPIMLALTAASPVWRGMLSDVDCRWDVIAMSVDDRTDEERGLKPLKEDRRTIPKSRYDSISSYISTDPTLRPEYNDISLVIDDDVVKRLKQNGIDELLARHYGHLFIRDPLVIFEELLEQDDKTSMDHFENIQSTNWQTVRFKPPPPSSSIGWRVEFRPMEVQLTDRANAAFAVFIVLLTRVILSFGLNLYIPISKVDENMKKAQRRGAVTGEKFYFRKNVFFSEGDARSGAVEEEFELMSINEIINGNCTGFPGLIPLINSYLTTVNIDIETRCELSRYLELVKGRADGSLKTGANWIRNFVRTHPAYKHDSIVSKEINYDLINMIEKINSGEVRVPELMGNQAV